MGLKLYFCLVWDSIWMGISYLAIVLIPDAGIYFPEQEINGLVQANVSSEINCRGMCLPCKTY